LAENQLPRRRREKSHIGFGAVRPARRGEAAYSRADLRAQPEGGFARTRQRFSRRRTVVFCPGLSGKDAFHGVPLRFVNEFRDAVERVLAI